MYKCFVVAKYMPGRSGERESKISISCLQYVRQPGMEPANWVCVLTGNQPPTSNQLSHTDQGCMFFNFISYFSLCFKGLRNINL